MVNRCNQWSVTAKNGSLRCNWILQSRSEIRNAENLTDEEKACITIVEDGKVEDKEFLLKEKERLLVRIAEIDKLLENM